MSGCGPLSALGGGCSYNQRFTTSDIAEPVGSSGCHGEPSFDTTRDHRPAGCSLDVLNELERHLAPLGEFQSKPVSIPSRLRTLVGICRRLRGELMTRIRFPAEAATPSNLAEEREKAPKAPIDGAAVRVRSLGLVYWLAHPTTRIGKIACVPPNHCLVMLRPLCDASARASVV